MKLLPDDPRLTAYALGELDDDESRRVERAVAADPALRISLDEIERTCGFMSDVFGAAGEARLRPSQRRAVLKASEPEPAVVRKSPAWKPWLVALGAAAAVVLAAVMLGQLGAGRKSPGTMLEAVALLPAPGPSSGSTRVASGGEETTAPSGSGGAPGDRFRELAKKISQAPLPVRSALPATTDLAGFSAGSELRLPVVTGTGSAVWVRRWIEERGMLPPRDAVRVEEMINSQTLPMKPLGDQLEAGVASMPCPWAPDRWLVGISLRAPEREVQGLVLRSLSERPRRVVGSYVTRSDAALPTTLPAGRSQLVLMEFSGEGALGTVELSDAAGHAFSLEIPEEKPDPAMLRAATQAAFGLWLRDEEVSADDLKKLLERTRDDDPIWMAQWRVIERALTLRGGAD
ncbi:VWA domain-containing protein [Haloferula sargassicola]